MPESIPAVRIVRIELHGLGVSGKGLIRVMQIGQCSNMPGGSGRFLQRSPSLGLFAFEDFLEKRLGSIGLPSRKFLECITDARWRVGFATLLREGTDGYS